VAPGAAVSVADEVVEPRATSPPRVDHGACARQRPRTVIVFIWAFLGVETMICAWSFATPIGAASDEPGHLVQAVAVVHGHFDEPTRPSPFGAIASVRVPGWAADTIAPCFVQLDLLSNPKKTGVAYACRDTLSRTTRSAVASDQFANAPPLYYAVAGIPSVFLSGVSALYAMRLVSGLANAALVALGISLLIRFHPRRIPLLGVLIALSPMVLFLLAVVNSSGLEISSAFATWCGALCIVEQPLVPRPLAIWTAVAAVLLVLSRPTSPLDAVIIVVVMTLLIGWRGLRPKVAGLVPLWSPVLVAVIVAVGFLVAFGPPHLTGVPAAHPVGLLSNMWTNVRLTGVWLRQCIGDFGWLDTPTPSWVVIVWTSCVGGLTAVALIVSAPCRRALPALAFFILAMPEILFAPQMNAVSEPWQGRYWLPVVVGFPLVASTFRWPTRWLRYRPAIRRWIPAAVALGLGLVLLAAQIASFLHALTRYEVGLGVRAGSPTVWLPPGGRSFVVVAFVIGAVVTLALVVFEMWPRVDVDVDAVRVRAASPKKALSGRREHA
jgi:hypothetical protein